MVLNKFYVINNNLFYTKTVTSKKVVLGMVPDSQDGAGTPEIPVCILASHEVGSSGSKFGVPPESLAGDSRNPLFSDQMHIPRGDCNAGTAICRACSLVSPFSFGSAAICFPVHEAIDIHLGNQFTLLCATISIF